MESELRIQELLRQRELRRQQQQEEQGETAPVQSQPTTGNNSGFGGVFAPGTLSGDGAEAETESEGNNSGFGGVFAPSTLSGDDASEGSDN